MIKGNNIMKTVAFLGHRKIFNTDLIKNRIIFSNKKMIDDCDLVVCYVNMKVSKSGSRTAINYAIKQKKKIINLFKN